MVVSQLNHTNIFFETYDESLLLVSYLFPLITTLPLTEVTFYDKFLIWYFSIPNFCPNASD